MTGGRPDPDLPRVPELEGEFELVRELGRGGTAVVYLARDRELGRDVAIKLIRPSYLQDEEAIARLEREARTVGKLQHPNIVLLLGSRRLGKKGLALILQYVPGETLKDALQRDAPLPVERVQAILTDVATGLAHAHRRRIVHRDIKPENVYLDEEAGVARLADFGIARAWDSDSGLTLPGTALGTPSYMSPEQVDGQDLDGRSDVYSLGLLAWEMLTGQVPWSGESLYNVIYKQKHEDLPSVTEFRDDVPTSLTAVIDRALQKNPKARWASAEEFLAALGVDTDPEPADVTPAVPDWLADLQVREGPPGAPPALQAPEGDVPSQGLPPQGVLPQDVPSQGVLPQGVPPQGPRSSRRSSGRGWLLWGGAALVLVVVGLLLQGPDAPLQTLLRSGGDLSGPEVDWEQWERPTGPAGEEGEGAAGRVGLDTLGTEASRERGDLTAEGVDPDPEGGAVAFPDPDAPSADPDAPQPADPLAPPADPLAPPPGSVLRVVQGAGQTGTAGEILPTSIVVVAEDADGARLSGVPVVVDVSEGGGSVTTSGSVTDTQGFLVLRWRMGAAGVQQAQIRFSGSDDDPVELSALANPSTPEVAFEPGALAPGQPPAPETAPGPGAAGPGDQLSLPSALSPRTTIAGGGSHSCILNRTGGLQCWGGGSRGQLGVGDGAGRDEPTRIPGFFTRVAVGVSHTCALDGDGTALCWGANDRGQLGDGTSQTRNEPTPVPGLPPLLDISAGANHTCALDTQGRAFCWGAGGQGQLGDGNTADRNVPVAVAGSRSFRQLAAGWEHTCGLDAQGRAFCWGSGGEGQLGWADLGSGAVPGPVQGNHRFNGIAPGGAHTCGLTTEGTVLCWGQGSAGRLGDGTLEGVRPTPAPVAGDERFREVTAGALHTCALTTEGEARCWGGNVHGQLGDGTTQNRLIPTPVEEAVRLTAIKGLGSHTCGLTVAGQAVCWGLNADGQLGDGSRTNRTSPTLVSGW